MRSEAGVYSNQIIEAIQTAASDPRPEDLGHLKDFSKAIFSSWLNARTWSAKHGNTLILLCLYKNNAWEIDAKTRETLDLILFVEGSIHLAPVRAPSAAVPASSHVTAETGAKEDLRHFPLEKITRAMAQLFIKCEIDDIQMQALILGRAIELFRHLVRQGQDNLWDGLVRLVVTQNSAS